MLIKYLCVILLLLTSFYLNSQEAKKVAKLPEVLEEASGMTYISGKGLFVLEDTKNPLIYRICEEKGKIKQVFQIEGYFFKDKESLTSDNNYLYVGDIGDNKGKRKSIKIIRIPLSAITTNEEEKDTITLEVEKLEIKFEDKTKTKKKMNNIYAFEAMIAVKDSIYLFSKRRKDHQTAVYAVPNSPSLHYLEESCVFDAKGLVTGATLHPDGKQLVLIGYQKRKKNPFIIHFSDWNICNISEGDYQFIPLFDNYLSFQGESLTFLSDDKLLLSNEWTRSYEQALYLMNFDFTR